MQSSANSQHCKVTLDGKSLMKSRNNSGDRTDPCRMPESTVVSEDDTPSTVTFWWHRNPSIHLRMLPQLCLRHLIGQHSPCGKKMVRLCIMYKIIHDQTCISASEKTWFQHTANATISRNLNILMHEVIYIQVLALSLHHSRLECPAPNYHRITDPWDF